MPDPVTMARRERHQRRRNKPKGRSKSPGGMSAKSLEHASKQTHKAIQDWLSQAKSARTEQDKPIKLDEWQQHAFDALMNKNNVVVDAPTTAGKTRVVESFFREHYQDPGFRAAYTTPVKSLSNDKLREFRAMFGRENVGIATGDIKDNLSAPIVVTTLETYRNSLLGVEPDLGRKLVIFDEYHFMQDESRGSAWEEAIILTPRECQLLLLSASVDNAEEFCAWLESTHGLKTELVRTTVRPVPLQPIIYFKDHWLLESFVPQKAKQRPKSEPFPLPHDELAERMIPLDPMGLCPCIVYAGRRRSTESLAQAIHRLSPTLAKDHQERIIKTLEDEDKETSALKLMPRPLRRMIESKGIAYHHSGLAPNVRIAIESLLKKGDLRYCVATMGLSIGINFSVRSALISDYQRPGEGGFVVYPPSEVLQMLGRAGRRGLDTVGFSLWPKAEGYARIGRARRDRCDSRLKNDPTTLLGLFAQGLDSRAIEKFYSRSFRRFNDTGIDLSLITAARVRKKLDVKKLPCDSPGYEYARSAILEEHDTACRTCTFRPDCHKYLEVKSENDLAALHLHLFCIGALDSEEKLTDYGNLARYFPQSGGLLIARYLLDHSTEANLTESIVLMAAMTLARHKAPSIPEDYEFPFDEEDLEEGLEEFYPIELFPELYDPPFGRRHYPVLREFNPQAGYIIKAWHEGMPWKRLEATVTNDKFATGDLMALIYRVATYLQSLNQAKFGEVSQYSGSVREELLRDPLSMTL